MSSTLTWRWAVRLYQRARIVGTIAGVLAGLGLALLPAAPALAVTPGNGTLGADSAVCDSNTYQYVVTWAFENYNANSAVSISEVAGAGTLSYRLNPADPLAAIPPSFIINAAPSAYGYSEANIVQRVPGTSTSASISMDTSWSDGTGGYMSQSHALAGTCKAPVYAKPAVKYGYGCNGTVTLTLTNNASGAPSLTYAISSAGGAYTRSVTVAAKQTKTLTIPSQYATGIMVKAGSYSDGPESWQQPTGCPTAAATPSASSSPGTGPATAGTPAPQMSEDAAVAQMGGVIESGVFGNSAFGANDSSDSQRTLLAVAVLLLLVLTVIAALLGNLVYQRRRARQGLRG
jgi:hypothetical protein